MSDLPKRLRIKASMIALGERIAWGSDTALMEEAADVIEALSASVENHQLHMLGMARDRDQLRALLTAQPQASAAQSAHHNLLGELYQVLGALDAPDSVLDNVSAAIHDEPLPHATLLPFVVSAQSAPAGEREAVPELSSFAAFADAIGLSLREADAKWDRALSLYEKLSAWQRKQSAGMPDAWRDALQKIARHAPPVNCAAKTEVEKLALIAVHALIAFSAPQFSKPTDHQSAKVGTAAPAQPAAQGEFGDAYQGAREDLAIWKRRALEAEAKVRHQDQIIDHLTLEAQGETRFGEPSLPAAGSAEWIEHGPSKACPFSSPYTSKVDVRLRDGTERLGDLACNTMWFWYEHDPKPYDVVAYRAAALAASTGQEVKHDA